MNSLIRFSNEAEAFIESVCRRLSYGTYVSLKGDQAYLDAGAEYYKTWGFPNVNVLLTQDVLDDSIIKKPIDTFRIVSHGKLLWFRAWQCSGLESQPSEGLDMKDWFTKKGTEFSDEARVRKHYTTEKTQGFVGESFFNRIISGHAEESDDGSNP
jgi:hypothetical protein